MSFVLDTSIALAWFFEDERTPVLTGLLDRLTQTGAVVPQLWQLEALNGLLVAERRGRIDGAKRRTYSSVLQRLPIKIDDQTSKQVWTAIAQLAEEHRLTAYDAAYLELAQRLGLPLATKDKLLITAAQKANVSLLATV